MFGIDVSDVMPEIVVFADLWARPLVAIGCVGLRSSGNLRCATYMFAPGCVRHGVFSVGRLLCRHDEYNYVLVW